MAELDKLECIISLQLGDRYFHAKEFSKVEEKYRNAVESVERNKDNNLIAISYYELGASLGMQGRDDEALNCFEESLKFTDIIPNPALL